MEHIVPRSSFLVCRIVSVVSLPIGILFIVIMYAVNGVNPNSLNGLAIAAAVFFLLSLGASHMGNCIRGQHLSMELKRGRQIRKLKQNLEFACLRVRQAIDTQGNERADHIHAVNAYLLYVETSLSLCRLLPGDEEKIRKVIQVFATTASTTMALDEFRQTLEAAIWHLSLIAERHRDEYDDLVVSYM